MGAARGVGPPCPTPCRERRCPARRAAGGVTAIRSAAGRRGGVPRPRFRRAAVPASGRSEEHTSELQSLMRISYAVFCLKKKNNEYRHTKYTRIYEYEEHIYKHINK